MDEDNFDAGANVDNGTCLYTGCMNEVADNYDVQANTGDQGEICLFSGCMDELASNYNIRSTSVRFMEARVQPAAQNCALINQVKSPH